MTTIVLNLVRHKKLPAVRVTREKSEILCCRTAGNNFKFFYSLIFLKKMFETPYIRNQEPFKLCISIQGNL